MKKILLIEDNKGITEGLCDTFTEPEYELLTAVSLKEAGALLSEHPGLVLLDVSLPDGNGFDFYSERLEKEKTPVIFLTARDEENDIVKGLELGADDYITKPFNILEVKARIKAIMRRTAKRKEEPAQSPMLVKGNMKIDCEGRRVFIGEKEINLTAKEFDVLERLAMNPNKVYSRENLLNLIWGYDYPGDARTVDVHIRRLREKIEQNPSEPKYVHTKWGVGYYFSG